MGKPQRRFVAGALGLLAACVSGSWVAFSAGIDQVRPIPTRLISNRATSGQPREMTSAEQRVLQSDFAAGRQTETGSRVLPIE